MLFSGGTVHSAFLWFKSMLQPCLFLVHTEKCTKKFKPKLKKRSQKVPVLTGVEKSMLTDLPYALLY